MIKMVKNKYNEFIVYVQIHSLNIVILAVMLSIFAFLGATSFLYLQLPSTNIHRQELEEYFQKENTRQEWERLYKYHGYPGAVIYEDGKTPYFYDKHGTKCAFIYPSKVAEPVHHRTDNNEYSIALSLNNQLPIK
jgi:hypothetical protein